MVCCLVALSVQYARGTPVSDVEACTQTTLDVVTVDAQWTVVEFSVVKFSWHFLHSQGALHSWFSDVGHK